MTDSGRHTGPPAVVASEIDEATESRDQYLGSLKWSALALGCLVITVGLAGGIVLRDGLDQLTGEVLLWMSASLSLIGGAAVGLLRRSKHLHGVIEEREEALSEELARTRPPEEADKGGSDRSLKRSDAPAEGV